MRAALLLLTLPLAVPAAAQSQNIAWLLDNSPTLGGGNAFPWGSDGVRYQVIVPNQLLGGRPALIQDLLVAGSGGDANILYGDIEIRMGLTPQVVPAASWTQNNPNPTTVYRGPLRVAIRNGAWRGIGLPTSYLFLPTSPGDNLCLEVIVWKVADMGGLSGINFYFPLCGTSASPGGPIPRAYLIQWVQGGGAANTTPPTAGSDRGNKMGLILGDGNAVLLGSGCRGTAGTPALSLAPNTWPRLGRALWVDLAGAAPGTPALLTVGVREWNWGPLGLPLDLGPFGGPGCRLWNDLLLMLAAPVLPGGTARLPLPIPGDPVLMSARILSSWLNLDAGANTLGLTTSNYAKLILGI